MERFCGCFFCLGGEGWQVCEGIEVSRWEFPLDNSRTFRVNLWDFGGQEIYHATHQFFLTHRSLYLVVADMRREDTDFDYWLQIIELLSDNSPLLIIKNEKQDRQREINESQLRGQFGSLKEILGTNLLTKQGLARVIEEVKHYARTLSHIGTALPRNWVKVRERLEQDKRNYISLQEFLDICEANGFTIYSDKMQLSGYLHDLGVILHFQDDPILKRTVILKPKWGTDAAYAALDSLRVRENRGRFTRNDLAEIWSAPEYAPMQDELLQLMMNFKLCYKIPNRNEYIAPQLLGESQPTYNWDAHDNIPMRYEYAFMPKGILTQLIVEKHGWIEKQELVWKSGVVLTHNGARAEVVENRTKREIRVRVSGPLKKELMTIVMYELDTIHDSYARLKYRKLIPCNCEECVASSDAYEFSYDDLQRALTKHRQTIECRKSFEQVNIRRLIDDVFETRRDEDKKDRYQDDPLTPIHINIDQSRHGGINAKDSHIRVSGDMVGGNYTNG